MGHQIEDCSTYAAVLLIIAWYAYGVFGSIVLIEDNSGKHCYVRADSVVPSATLSSGDTASVFDDGAEHSRYIASMGLIILVV